MTRLTDDFDSILREIESRLVLHDSVDELINQIDYYRSIDVLDDEDKDNV